MGEEMCCSDKPEQSEISYLKPERNLILNKYNSRVKYSISPEIKFESEGLNDKDDTENNNSLNIISNDELVYGTIDSLRYKDIKQKKSYHNARNDNKISNSHTTINSKTINTSNNYNINNDNINQKKTLFNNNKNTSYSNIRNSKSIIDEKILETKGDEDGPRDGAKKNKQQINEENIISTSNNPSKANELIDNNFFDSNNINKLNNIKFNNEDKDKDKDKEKDVKKTVTFSINTEEKKKLAKKKIKDSIRLRHCGSVKIRVKKGISGGVNSAYNVMFQGKQFQFPSRVVNKKNVDYFKQFFFLLIQAMKINSDKVQLFLGLDPESLYNQCKSEHVPFHKYQKWLEHQLMKKEEINDERKHEDFATLTGIFCSSLI